jgi:hypothetical protein
LPVTVIQEVLDDEHMVRDVVVREQRLELMLTRLAPVLAVAFCGNVHLAMFGAQIPARSSFCTPTSSRASTSASTSARSGAKIHRWPVGTCTSASRAGSAATVRSKLSPMFFPSRGTSDMPDA